jgi:hypothetical protein
MRVLLLFDTAARARMPEQRVGRVAARGAAIIVAGVAKTGWDWQEGSGKSDMKFFIAGASGAIRADAELPAVAAGMAESLSSERLPWRSDACFAPSAQAIL